MSDENKVMNAEFSADGQAANGAYMNRMFCSTKERVSFILHNALGGLSLGKYDVGSELWLYKIYPIEPVAYANASGVLTIWDMINDPMSAAIVDNMRTRWGKFKPFQYLSLGPSVILGLVTCLLPVISLMFGMTNASRLTLFMITKWISETVGAFFGGGGYIDNVFTPNPNERTSLLVSSEFVKSLINKFPSQLMGILYDMIGNGILNASVAKVFVAAKTVIWVIATVPNVMWYIFSRERVPQSEKPPNPIKGVLSVFTNRPLLIYTLSGLIDGIDIGTGEDLYYNDVLHFNLLPTVAGIPGSPISYASYALAPKFRRKFSTRALWFLSKGSIVFSETLFFLVGLIGGKEKGLYLKKIPMTIAFGLGNCVEMLFYATKGIIGKEINYEVLDYCEWKNGFRVEATIGLLSGYLNKAKNALLLIINNNLLQNWTNYQIGENAEQTPETKWRLFLIAFGPHLIFDLLSLFPMLLYNLDKETRSKMYRDLEVARAERAAEEKKARDDA